MVKGLLESENKNIADLRKRAVFFNVDKTKLLHDLLCREIELSQECCFLLLSFVYSETNITNVQQGLAAENDETNSNAVELLLQTLNKADKELFVEQLIYAPYREEPPDKLDRAKLEEYLQAIIDYTSHSFMPALAAATVYTIGILQVKALAGFVQKQESIDDALMKEMAFWVLQQLEIAG